MKLPGFTAEASVGPTVQVYRVQDRCGTAGVADVFPQLEGEDLEHGLLEEGMDEEGMDEEGAMEMADEEEAEPSDEV